ncbi:MAG: hypothetical protein WD602_11045 [Actinomycetota bacterium]
MHRGPILLMALILAATVLGGCAPDAADPVKQADRVLIISLPGVRWADVLEHDTPNLDALLETAAIGDLSTRIGRRPASVTEAYLSIGAGTRAMAPPEDAGVALDPDETYLGVRASTILQRRLGEVPSGVVYLSAAEARARNDSSPFGAQPGHLGDLLREAGVERAVIANADTVEDTEGEDPPDRAYARGAVTALMGTDGVVPHGTVGRSLLQRDPAAAFGHRLNPDAVLRAFDSFWSGDGTRVALVEASDLHRASLYELETGQAQGQAVRAAALAGSDELLGALIGRTDPSRDAVLVLSPVTSGSSPELAVAALRSPGVKPGLLRSSTTRRDGYVQLADVAPTVLDLVGLEHVREMEGRPFQVAQPDVRDRVSHLIAASEDADFHESLMTKVVLAIFVLVSALLAAVVFRHRLPGRLRGWIEPLAMGILGLVPGTYLVAQLDFVRQRTVLYFAGVMFVAAATAATGLFIERRREGLGLMAVLGAIAVLFSLDVVLGAPLQVNSVFGYSVAVAGRFAGFGNLAFALFGTTAVLLAVLTVERHGRRALWPVLVMLGLVVLVEGLPMLGGDVGGVVSMVPAFGVTGLLLAGRRLRWLHIAGLGAGTLALVLAFAFVDASRPPGARTHLARLAQNLLEGRWSPFADSVGRRLQASFGSAELTAWVSLAVLMLGAAVYVFLVARGTIGLDAPPRRREPGWSAAVAGLGVLAVMGLVANDSSLAVPATMFVVAAPVFAIRYTRAAGGAE